ncbi:ATP-binding protein [Kibdelosporangium lantanae]
MAFLLLSILTAPTVAGVMYVSARNAILDEAQNTVARTLIAQLPKMLASARLPLDESRIVSTLGDKDTSVVILHRGEPNADIPAALREYVRPGRVGMQRMIKDGRPGLLIGTSLTVVLPNSNTYTPDLEIYLGRSLADQDAAVGRLALEAWLVGGSTVLVAILLAVVAATSVLRPVRDLGRAARNLGQGDFSTRVPVRGADELAGVARTFNTTAEALERQINDARRFVADVSHELRTPLAAMIAVTDILDEEAPHLPADAGDAARLVSEEAKNLARLVNDLMEVSRFDSGTANLTLDDINLAEAITATLRTRGWLNDVVTYLPSVRAVVDPRRLDLIVANLVGNAMRHGSPPVMLTLRADAAWVVVEVRDHGPGLAPDVLPHVFDRFYKADTARKRSSGSGLGLAIAWENAHLHHGTLTAGNHPDGGAVFTLTLPGQEPSHEEALVVMSLLLLTACGIQPTGVIPAGPAPRVKVGGTALYFVRDGVLTPITTPEPERAEAALSDLAVGTSLPGYTSEVPRSIVPARRTQDGIALAGGTAGLSTMAIDQIVCTAGPESPVVGLAGRSCPVR